MPNRNSTTKDTDQDNRLIISRLGNNKLGKALMLFIALIPISIFIIMAIQMAPRFANGLSFDLETLWVIALMTFVSFLGFAVFTQLFPPRTQRGREQSFSNSNRAIRNALMVIWLIPLILFLGKLTFDFLFPGGLKQGLETDWNGGGSSLMEKIFIGLGILLVYWIWITFILRTIRTSVMVFKHGKVTAIFDLDYYQIGGNVSVQVTDRNSNSEKQAYRVHMNLVEEVVVKSGSGKNRSAKYKRIFHHTDYQDVSPRELADGISFDLPESLPNKSVLTDMSNISKPYYWELLVEEQGAHFWARFFIQVG
ncbi:MAG: hypothetical protein AB8F95_15035 [Bacteroidia bacterium]